MSVDTTTLLRTLLERAHTISRDASLQDGRGEGKGKKH